MPVLCLPMIFNDIHAALHRGGEISFLLNGNNEHISVAIESAYIKIH